MKTTTVLTLALSSLLLFTQKTKAQESAFEKGTIVATLGYGFPDLNRASLRSFYNVYNNTTVRGFGPIILKGDYGIYKFKWGHSVGAGIVMGFSNNIITYNYLSNYYLETDKYTTITIGARGSYHFFTKEKIDCYANIGAGFNINNEIRTTSTGITNSNPVSKRSGVYEAFTVGIRYYFSKNFGVYAEAGWDMSTPVQGGIALKF
jgi:predicted porin